MNLGLTLISPWKECHEVDERLRFIAPLLDGEKMAELCREFGISRITDLTSAGGPTRAG